MTPNVRREVTCFTVLVALGIIVNILLVSLTPAPARVGAAVEQEPGLVASYPLSGSPGPTLMDVGPHHLDGTCYGVKKSVPGLAGSAYSFNGTSGYCAVQTNPLISPTTAFTVTALVNLHDLKKLYALVGKSNFNSDGFRLYTDSSGNINFAVVANAGDQTISAPFPGAGQWVFVAATYDQQNQALYINGREVKSQLGNPGFTSIAPYSGALSDSLGLRAYPWGFESQKGATTNTFNGNGTITMQSSNDENATLFAIPGMADKPVVIAGQTYTQSFDVQYNIASGNGIRVIHQWFNTVAPNAKPFASDFGPFVTGSSLWTTLSLTATAPPGAIRGDIILELWGTGTVQAKNPQYYLTNPMAAKVTTTTQPLLLGQTTASNWSMNGYLQHVMFFDQALSSDDVRALASRLHVSL